MLCGQPEATESSKSLCVTITDCSTYNLFSVKLHTPSPQETGMAGKFGGDLIWQIGGFVSDPPN